MKYLHRFFCWLGMHDPIPVRYESGIDHPHCQKCWMRIKGEDWERP